MDKLQHYLSSCREVVQAHKEAYSRDQEAAAFQDLKRIVAQFGVHNALVMLADVCTELSLIESDDWETASVAIGECADACKLEYNDGEDENDDAITVALDNRARLQDFK